MLWQHRPSSDQPVGEQRFNMSGQDCLGPAPEIRSRGAIPIFHAALRHGFQFKLDALSLSLQRSTPYAPLVLTLGEAPRPIALFRKELLRQDRLHLAAQALTGGESARQNPFRCSDLLSVTAYSMARVTATYRSPTGAASRNSRPSAIFTPGHSRDLCRAA